MNSRRRKDGHQASDSDSSELAMGLQCVSGGGLASSALGGPVNDPALSATAVTGLAAKQRTQARSKVGKRRVVACFDGQPRQPVQQPVSSYCFSAASTSLAPSMTSAAADIGNSTTDVTGSTELHTDGTKCTSLLPVLQLSLRIFKLTVPACC